MTRHDEAMRALDTVRYCCLTKDPAGGYNLDDIAAYIADLEAALALAVCSECGGQTQGTNVYACHNRFHDLRKKVM